MTGHTRHFLVNEAPSSLSSRNDWSATALLILVWLLLNQFMKVYQKLLITQFDRGVNLGISSGHDYGASP